MLIHLDTSILVDAFSGARRSMPALREASLQGHVTTFATLVLYEWLRGSRADGEVVAVERFFSAVPPSQFGPEEAKRAAALFRQVSRARRRQVDLAIAACAIEARASLWTLNRSDFRDLPGLMLYEKH